MATMVPSGLNVPGWTTAVPRKTAARAGSRKLVAVEESKPPTEATRIRPESPARSPATT
jgi:hypothetical protein